MKFNLEKEVANYSISLIHKKQYGDRKYTSFYETTVRAKNFDQAIKKAKRKWCSENRRERRKGVKVYYTSKKKSYLVPKVHKSKMSPILEECLMDNFRYKDSH